MCINFCYISIFTIQISQSTILLNIKNKKHEIHLLFKLYRYAYLGMLIIDSSNMLYLNPKLTNLSHRYISFSNDSKISLW